MTALAGATRVLFLHAHPDDETLATGALLVELAERGVETAVLTATRGEQGELRPEAAPGDADLTGLRERELAGALAVLGVHRHGFLGQPPARAAGLPPRRYVDSGMVWVNPQLAGPGPEAGPEALTAADVAEAAADVTAYAEWFGADTIVSYDEGGGYGHPDHVACHWIAREAAGLAGTGFVELVSRPAPDGPGGWELRRHRERVRQALLRYRSQLGVEGDDVVHVGGQRHPIPTDVVLRVVATGWHA